ncbi:MAG: D-aminoacyl-tRNA deacylase [Rikenellaceae bacterium]
MRALIQRVDRASVEIEGAIYSQIKHGLLILLGVEDADTREDIEWLAGKIARMRIFDDEAGVMNLDVMQVAGQALVVSQFTLHASTRRGNRPSYIRAAGEAVAKPLYEEFCQHLSELMGQSIGTGIFGADMRVSLTNNGPATIWIDSKNRE